MLPTKESNNTIGYNFKEQTKSDGVGATELRQNEKDSMDNTLPSFRFSECSLPSASLKFISENQKLVVNSSDHPYSFTSSTSTPSSNQNTTQVLSSNYSATSPSLSQELPSQNRSQQILPSLKDLYGILNNNQPIHQMSDCLEHHSAAHFPQKTQKPTVRNQSGPIIIQGGKFVVSRNHMDGTGFNLPHNSFQTPQTPQEDCQMQDGNQQQQNSKKRSSPPNNMSSSNSSTSMGGSSDTEFSDEAIQSPQTQNGLSTDPSQPEGSNASYISPSNCFVCPTSAANHHAKSKKRKKKKKKKKKNNPELIADDRGAERVDSNTNNIVLPSLVHMAPQHLYHTNNTTEDSTGFPIRKQSHSSSAFLSPRNLTNANIGHPNQDFMQHQYYHKYRNTNTNSSLNHSQSLSHSPTHISKHSHQPDSHHQATFSTAALFQHNNYFATHPNASFSSNTTSSGSSSSSNGMNSTARVIVGGNVVVGESSSSNSNSSNSISSTIDTKSSSSSGHNKNTANQVTNEGPWSEEEHAKFLQGLQEMGRNWTKIAKDYVKSRVRTQVASHAQKYFKKLNKANTPSDKQEQEQESLQE